MKKQTAPKARICRHIFSFLFTVLTFTAAAAPATDSLLQSVKVKHLSSQGDKLMFEVQLKNDRQQRFSVLVKDDEGTHLFHKFFNDRDFSQRFLLEGVDADRKITFVIRARKNQQAYRYEINRSIRLVDDYVVTRL